jgi:hypothetical protein
MLKHELFVGSQRALEYAAQHALQLIGWNAISRAFSNQIGCCEHLPSRKVAHSHE